MDQQPRRPVGAFDSTSRPGQSGQSDQPQPFNSTASPQPAGSASMQPANGTPSQPAVTNGPAEQRPAVQSRPVQWMPDRYPKNPNTPQAPEQNLPPQYLQSPVYNEHYAQPSASFNGVGNRRRKSRKPLIIGVAASFLVLAGAAAYVFGIYIPNKPENVWATGFTRSSQALDTMVSSASSPETKKAYEKLQARGSVTLSSGTTKASGTISGKFDSKAVDGTMTVNYTDGSSASAQQVKLGLDVRSLMIDGSKYPDSYFRLTGIKALGLEEAIPGINQYDGRWIEVSSKYLEQKLPLPDDKTGDGKQPQLTADDVTEVVHVFADTTKQYVLTNDPAKAVVIRKQFVAKETSEGMPAYHYKAGIDKNHAKDYCVALSNAFMDTNAYKKFVTDNQARSDARRDAEKQCATDAADAAKDDSFDLWVTADKKLIQKVRFDDPDEAGTYVEAGQTYDSGDVVPQFFRLHSDKDKMTIEQNGTYDMKTHDISLTIDGKGEKTDDHDEFTFNFRMALSPLDGTVPSDKPANSQPLPDVLKKLGIDPNALMPRAANGPAASNV